jgi:hypothetical protein
MPGGRHKLSISGHIELFLNCFPEMDGSLSVFRIQLEISV